MAGDCDAELGPERLLLSRPEETPSKSNGTASAVTPPRMVDMEGMSCSFDFEGERELSAKPCERKEEDIDYMDVDSDEDENLISQLSEMQPLFYRNSTLPEESPE